MLTDGVMNVGVPENIFVLEKASDRLLSVDFENPEEAVNVKENESVELVESFLVS
jgi:hypothetical protein